MKKEFSHIKKPGFTTPENYLHDAESRVNERLTLEKKVSNQNSFRVPDNYFDTVESQILSRVTTEKTKVIPLFKQRYFKAAMAVAATVALFFTLQTIYFSPTPKDDFSTYVIENEHIYLNQYEIAELFEEETLETLPLNTGLSQQEIIEYLAYFSDDINYED